MIPAFINTTSSAVRRGARRALWFSVILFIASCAILSAADKSFGYVQARSVNVITARGITAGPDGCMWFVATTGGNSHGKLFRATPLGPAKQIRLPGFSDRSRITAITAGPDGRIWVAATKARFSGRATVYRVTATSSSSSALPNRMSANAMASGPDGRVWFLGAESHSIGKISTTGVVSTIRVKGARFLEQLVQGRGGQMWAAGSTLAVELSSTKVVRRVSIGRQYATDLARDASGNIWITGLGSVQAISPLGTLRSWPTAGDVLGVFQRADQKIGFTAGLVNADQDGIYLAGSRLGVVNADASISETSPDEVPVQWQENADNGLGYSKIPGLKTAASGPGGKLWLATSVNVVGSTGLTVFGLSPDFKTETSTTTVASTKKVGRTLIVRLRCAGQPGRLCAGQLQAKDARRARVSTRTAFATSPGDQNVVRLQIKSGAAGHLSTVVMPNR